MIRGRLACVAGGLALSALLLGTGCGEDPIRFNRLLFEDVSYAQDVAEVETRSITLSEGTAIRARVTAIDSEGKRMAPLELDSRDRSIMTVDPGVAPDTFVFVGAGVGSTRIDIVIGGRTRGEVAAEVVPQSAP